METTPKTTATNKLFRAMELMKEAKKLMLEAKQENKSLRNYYGQTLTTIANVLDKYSDNSKNKTMENACIKDIIEARGDDWKD